MPALTALIGVTFLIVLWQGGRLVMLRPHHARRMGGVLYVPRPADLADGGAGMGDEHFSARRGFDGPPQLHFRAQPKINDAAAGLRRRGQRRFAHRPEMRPKIRGEIEFRNLSFRVSNGRERQRPPTPVLKDINSAYSGRLDPRDCRPDRQRQIDSGRAGRAALGSAAGRCASRWPLRSANGR